MPYRAAVTVMLVLASAQPSHAWFESSEVGVRALGLGSAFVSAADDVSAVYWNPAGLVQLRRHQLLLSLDRSADLPELDREFVAVGVHLQPLVLGLGWQHVALEDATREDLWSVSVAAAPIRRSLGAFLSGGATVKLARVGLDPGPYASLVGLQESAYGVAVDLAILIAPIPNVVVGATMRNLGEPRFDLLEGGSSTRLEREFEWGASLRWRRDGWLRFGRVGHPGGGTATRAGVELRVAGPLGVRTGFGDHAVTGGVDVRVGRWTFDTAYRAHDSLGPSYRIGLQLGWGTVRTGVGGEYDEF